MHPPNLPTRNFTSSHILSCNLPWSLAGLVSLQGVWGEKSLTLGGSEPTDNWQICCWKRKLSAFGVSPQKPEGKFLEQKILLVLFGFYFIGAKKLKKLRAKECAKSNNDYLSAFLTVFYPISFQHNPHAYPSHYIPVSSMLRWDFEEKSEYSLPKNKKTATFSNPRGKEWENLKNMCQN